MPFLRSGSPLFPLCLALLLGLAGCAQPLQPTQYNELVWRGQREKLEQLDHWSLTGKLAIFTSQQKGSARLNWQQQGDDYKLVLTSLIGTTIMEIQRQQGVVTITDDKGVRRQDSNPQALVYRLTGWAIPIAQLPTWIKGLPGDADYQLGGDGRVTELRKGDWQLHYKDYALTRLWLLPTGLELNGPETRIKLVIDEWQIDK